ncbi:MAG TPA: hypothetical protein VGL02_03155 [Streptomyces sp.]
MTIDWQALGTVLGVTLVATVGLVGLFTLGIVGLSKSAPATGDGGGAAVLARAGGYLCFAACAAAVSWGIYLIIG